MPLPNSKEEYLQRFYKSHKVEGFGLDTTVVYPCPFCAAANWARHKILEIEEVMSKPHHCGECDRSAKLVFNRTTDSLSFEIVQTGGPDQEDWFEPKMRRVD